jgi:ubiquinol-cytochrome c reductase cytochrome c subunit
MGSSRSVARGLPAAAAALVAVALALTALAATAHAQPPTGIARPDAAQERTLSPLQLGAQLFAGNCASCHGGDGRGITPTGQQRGAGNVGAGPSLHGVGALAPDFYLRTGYMPLGDPFDQPERSRVLLHEREIKALTAYVASLDGGPPIPSVHPAQGDLGRGRELFTEHCAGCHQVVAQGGVVTGARVPPLEDATPVQVAEAVRIGPYLMPRFSERQISDAELQDIVRYVQWTKHPTDRGGWGIGNLGPFPEGLVTWLIAAVVLIATCAVIGKRVSS